MRRRWFAVLVVAAVAGGAVPSGAVAAGTYRRVSAATFRPTEVRVSGNGRYVVFVASPGPGEIAPDNPTGEPREATQVYVADLKTGAPPELISVSIRGTLGNFDSSQPSISADGRYVVFASMADNLVPGDTNTDQGQVQFDSPWASGRDIFVRDRKLRRTTRISLSRRGREHDRGYSFHPVVSADGSTIAYYSTSNVLDDPSFSQDTNHSLYVVPRVGGPGKVRPVFVAADGSVPKWRPWRVGEESTGPWAALSATGRFVVGRDPASDDRVLRRDLRAKLATPMPAAPPFVSQGVPLSASGLGTAHVSMDAAGTKVLVEQIVQPSATNLATGRRVLLWNVRTGTVVEVDGGTRRLDDPTDLAGDRAEATGSYASQSTISGNGRFVVFTRSELSVNSIQHVGASVPERYRVNRVYVKDLTTNSVPTPVVTCAPAPPEVCGDSFAPSISDHGSVVAFITAAALEPAKEPALDATKPGDASARARYPDDVYVRV